MQVIAAVAEFERDLLIERTHDGLARAKAEGKALARHSKLSDADKAGIRAKLAAGASLGQMAAEYDVSQAAIQRVQKQPA